MMRTIFSLAAPPEAFPGRAFGCGSLGSMAALVPETALRVE